MEATQIVTKKGFTLNNHKLFPKGTDLDVLLQNESCLQCHL